jgi:hypothetical protein
MIGLFEGCRSMLTGGSQRQAGGSQSGPVRPEPVAPASGYGFPSNMHAKFAVAVMAAFPRKNRHSGRSL